MNSQKYNKVIDELKRRGFPDMDNKTDSQLKLLVKHLPDLQAFVLPDPRIDIVDYKPKYGGETHKYVQTKNYTCSDGTTAKGLFLRADRKVIEAALEDLFEALNKLP